MYTISLVSGPSIEPVTLAQARAFIRLGSTDFAAALTASQSLSPMSRTAGTYNGTAIDVLTAQGRLVELQVGVCTGSLVATVQEGNTPSGPWTTVSTFATASTGVNENAVLSYEYTGSAQYIRVVGIVSTAAVVFGASVSSGTSSSPEDAEVTRAIKAARRWLEAHTGLTFISQTFDMMLDAFPKAESYGISSGKPTPTSMELPRGPLTSVTGVYHIKSAESTETTWATTNYRVVLTTPYGRIVLKDNGTGWPTDFEEWTCRVRFVAGYGATAASVPEDAVKAILLVTKALWDARGQESDKVQLPGLALELAEGLRAWRI